MSSLIKTSKLGQLSLKNSPLLVTAIRNHWNKDFKPAPYPKTEEERLKAAEKYGLHPSEYEPYPDDGAGSGDYPKLPLVGIESRDPYYPWDNPEHKRNFNEPLSSDYDLIREDRVNMNAQFRFPLWVQVLQLVGVLGGSAAIFLFFEMFKAFHPLVPRQYPRDGKKHYTFETD